MSWLTGERGRVFCFEPSPENLRYLQNNAARCPLHNVSVVPSAVGDYSGAIKFYMETITGQNSTTVETFRGLEINSAFNGLPAKYEECTVQMITADSMGLNPDFVKIDVESGELSVLTGMQGILDTRRPRIMVETGEGSPAIALLERAGYIIFPPKECNVVAVHRDDAEGLEICAS
jgi:FkbM family methyltransferase